MRKRDKPVLIRLTEKEKEYLERQSQNAGLKVEPYIRKLIMNKEILPRPPDEYIKILRELSAIGNNVNQLARRANGIGVIEVLEVTKLREELNKLWQEVKKS